MKNTKQKKNQEKRQNRKLLNFTKTKNSTEHIRAWRKFVRPVELFLGIKAKYYSPGTFIFENPKIKRVIILDQWFIENLNEAIKNTVEEQGKIIRKKSINKEEKINGH